LRGVFCALLFATHRFLCPRSPNHHPTII
jgi:hypothetical protein